MKDQPRKGRTTKKVHCGKLDRRRRAEKSKMTECTNKLKWPIYHYLYSLVGDCTVFIIQTTSGFQDPKTQKSDKQNTEKLRILRFWDPKDLEIKQNYGVPKFWGGIKQREPGILGFQNLGTQNQKTNEHTSGFWDPETLKSDKQTWRTWDFETLKSQGFGKQRTKQAQQDFRILGFRDSEVSRNRTKDKMRFRDSKNLEFRRTNRERRNKSLGFCDLEIMKHGKEKKETK